MKNFISYLKIHLQENFFLVPIFLSLLIAAYTEPVRKILPLNTNIRIFNALSSLLFLSCLIITGIILLIKKKFYFLEGIIVSIIGLFLILSGLIAIIWGLYFNRLILFGIT
jgi:hypothetical protein